MLTIAGWPLQTWDYICAGISAISLCISIYFAFAQHGTSKLPIVHISREAFILFDPTSVVLA